MKTKKVDDVIPVKRRFLSCFLTVFKLNGGNIDLLCEFVWTVKFVAAHTTERQKQIMQYV